MCARKDDLVFLIDLASQWNVLQPGLQGKIDLDHIGVTGHSFAAARRAMDRRRAHQARRRRQGHQRPRVKAIVPLAGGGTTSPWFESNSFNHVHIPVMHIVGTEDGWLDKLSSYTNMPDGDKYYVALDNVDHLDFVDDTNAAARKRAHQHHRARARHGVLRRYLKDDKHSKKKYLKPEYVRTLTTLQFPACTGTRSSDAGILPAQRKARGHHGRALVCLCPGYS